MFFKHHRQFLHILSACFFLDGAGDHSHGWKQRIHGAGCACRGSWINLLLDHDDWVSVAASHTELKLREVAHCAGNRHCSTFAENTTEGFLLSPQMWQVPSCRSAPSWKVPGETSGYRQKSWGQKKLTGVQFDNFRCLFDSNSLLCFLFFSFLRNLDFWLETNKWPLLRGRLSKHTVWKLTNTVPIIGTGSVLNQL